MIQRSERRIPSMRKNRDVEFVDDVEFVIEGTELRGLSRRYPRLEVIVIPEGVEVIGRKALFQASCKKLVMPSTLKEIKAYAFYQAEIGEIDFGDCKLKRIGSYAFSGCAAKTKLPDTVEEIYQYGISSLDIKKGKTLRLPSSLRFFNFICYDLYDVKVLEIGEKTFAQEMLIEDIFRRTLGYKIWITVRVMRLGVPICELIIFEEFNYEVFDSTDIFDYKKYDETIVSYIKSMSCKVNAAALRLLYPINLSSEYERYYRKYVSRNFHVLIQGKEEDIETIRKYDEAGLITIYRLKQLLKMATDKQNIEVSAFLLDLIGKKEGALIKSLKL
jgi:hypothetical protein